MLMQFTRLPGSGLLRAGWLWRARASRRHGHPRTQTSLRRSGLAILLAAVVAGLVLAAQPAKSDPVLLHLHVPGQPAPLPVTRSALMALPQTRIETSTIWTSGVPVFEGPTLHALLQAHGLLPQPEPDSPDVSAIPDATLRLIALNGYRVDMPLRELGQQAPVLALTRDGALLTARDKGPVWVIYPYDADRAWRSEIVYARSIWQLRDIAILPDPARSDIPGG